MVKTAKAIDFKIDPNFFRKLCDREEHRRNSKMSFEDTEERLLHDKELYMDKDPIFKKTVDLDYIIQPRGMIKRENNIEILKDRIKEQNKIINEENCNSNELFITQCDESTLPDSRSLMYRTHAVNFSKPEINQKTNDRSKDSLNLRESSIRSEEQTRVDSKSSPIKSTRRETRNKGLPTFHQTADHDIMKYEISAYEEQFLKNLVTFNKNRSKNIRIMPTRLLIDVHKARKEMMEESEPKFLSNFEISKDDTKKKMILEKQLKELQK